MEALLKITKNSEILKKELHIVVYSKGQALTNLSSPKILICGYQKFPNHLEGSTLT